MKKPKARNASVDWTIPPPWRSRSASRLGMMISGPMPGGSPMVMATGRRKDRRADQDSANFALRFPARFQENLGPDKANYRALARRAGRRCLEHEGRMPVRLKVA